jgi:Domain of unknown function DUF29
MTTSKYETDFYTWANEQAALVRAGRFNEVDIENIAEELETLGRSEARELKSHYRTLLLHLLKWRYQADERSWSWETTIKRERGREIPDHMKENPGLKPRRQELFEAAYALARGDAVNAPLLDRLVADHATLLGVFLLCGNLVEHVS